MQKKRPIHQPIEIVIVNKNNIKNIKKSEGENTMELRLEKWKENEYLDFYHASKDEELYAYMSDDFPKTEEKCKQIVRFFSESTDTSEYIRAIKVDGQLAGCIAAYFDTGLYCKNAELAYWITKELRGKGIMTQGIKQVAQQLFSEFSLHRIWARPFESNQGSCKTLEKAGFFMEGVLKENVYKNGIFVNSIIYAHVKQNN